MSWRIREGDCVEVMAELDESSVDAVVTDPPYGLEFMGKEWDRLGASTDPTTTSAGGVGAYAAARVRYGASFQQMQGWHQAWALEALRVLKPGGHLLAFGGTRTYHRLACALEDAGFEIRDCLAWLYGSGFPKSLDVSKVIDKAAGAEREVVGIKGVSSDFGDHAGSMMSVENSGGRNQATTVSVTAPATPDAERWQGWGTALKPAFEPIVLARKPLAERNVAANVLAHGTGAINVDGTRIETEDNTGRPTGTHGWQQYTKGFTRSGELVTESHLSGRWPANVLLDEEAAQLVDEASGETKSTARTGPPGGRTFGGGAMKAEVGTWFGDTGGASRFFYTAKTSRAEREVGKHYGSERNDHPTVKPIDLMQWLCRLVTPPGGLVLDPFTGSGSTGIAALREGFSFLGIEREPSYVEIARARIQGDSPLFNLPEEVVAEP